MEEEGYIKNSGHKGHEIQVAHGSFLLILWQISKYVLKLF
jgi:hypothetical protein